MRTSARLRSGSARLGVRGRRRFRRPTEPPRDRRRIHSGAGTQWNHGVGDQDQRLVLADHALAQPVLDPQQPLDLGLQHSRDRDPGPLRDHLGDVLGVDLLLQHPLRLLQVGEGGVERGELALETRQRAVLQLGRAAEVAAVRGLLGLEARLLDLLLGRRRSGARLLRGRGDAHNADMPSTPSRVVARVGGPWGTRRHLVDAQHVDCPYCPLSPLGWTSTCTISPARRRRSRSLTNRTGASDDHG